ncbi:hypothetical protein C0991_007654 [Blastosporella zonata]|nr:hypothetical protein C0991_007654 [Blastosporella zonata]
MVRRRTFNDHPVDVESATEIRLNLHEAELTTGPLRQLGSGLTRFWHRFTRKGKKNVPVIAGLRAIAFSSVLNLFVIFTPLAWVAHWKKEDGERVFKDALTFTCE